MNSYFFQDLVISQALSRRLFILYLCLILVYFVRNFINPITVLQVSPDLGFPLQFILHPNRVWAQLASYAVDNNFLYPGVKQTGREFNYSFPSNFDHENEWIYASYSLYAFMACTGTNLPAPLFFYQCSILICQQLLVH